ncbi:hypothetical protein PSYMO_11545 [Pseudomonas amygdali pv. mori str. 301020]|uniref:Uncharacterized protein n=2 Tax=Pseudomonas syringae group TaxID=136849 RepID=A0A656G9V3_PSEA0|nr:hypothetical protein PSYMO_11545 [Pseudomonas amygdali pv. mori str. 301020]PYD17887.1 hypothetical protein DND62_00385 [Pseudomonas syringae pv. pisi]
MKLDEDTGMDNRAMLICERARRAAIDKLKGISLGDADAIQPLKTLSDPEQQTEQMCLSSIDLISVSAVIVRGHRIITDESIPEPWRTRFSIASLGSTRLPEGSYERDWIKFNTLWRQEIIMVRAHRQAQAVILHTRASR